MGKFGSNTLAVASELDSSQWDLGKAIFDDIGPPSEDGVKDGSREKLEELAGVLAEQGYDYKVQYLRMLRDVYHKFPADSRLSAACFDVHRLAQSPEMLQVIVKSACLKDGQRLKTWHNLCHVRKMMKQLYSAGRGVVRA